MTSDKETKQLNDIELVKDPLLFISYSMISKNNIQKVHSFRGNASM